MCVLIAAPAGKVVPPEYLTYCNEHNPHGIGMAWCDGQQLRTWKTAYPKNIGHALQQAKRITDFDRLIHFRWATSGTKDKTNVHPFFANPERTVAMAHNGVLTITNVADKSDTRTFADHFLAYMKDGWWRDAVCVEQVERLLHFDRIALLSLTDGLVLLNPQQWEEEGGVAYSNMNYKPSKYSTHRGGVGFRTTSGKVAAAHDWYADDYDIQNDPDWERRPNGHWRYVGGKKASGPASASSCGVVTTSSSSSSETPRPEPGDYRKWYDAPDGRKAGISLAGWTAAQRRAPATDDTRESVATRDGTVVSKNDSAVVRNAAELDAALDRVAATEALGNAKALSLHAHTMRKEAPATADELDAFERNIDGLIALNIDPVVGYFIYASTATKSQTYCAKCVDPALALVADRAQPILASDCAVMFSAEVCLSCGVELDELAALSCAALLEEMRDDDDDDSTPGEAAAEPVVAEAAPEAPAEAPAEATPSEQSGGLFTAAAHAVGRLVDAVTGSGELVH